MLDNAPSHIHVLIEVTKDCVDVVNKMTSTTFVVPCLLSFSKYLILGCRKFHLSRPLMEKLKIAVNYNNSINNSTDIGGASLRRRLPQVCFASQTRSIQTQTNLITNLTIERFINNLNGDNSAEFSKIIDIILSGYGRLEIDSNTLFVKFIMEKKFKFLKFLEPAITPVASVLAKKKTKKNWRKRQLLIIIENYQNHKFITSYI